MGSSCSSTHPEASPAKNPPETEAPSTSFEQLVYSTRGLNSLFSKPLAEMQSTLTNSKPVDKPLVVSDLLTLIRDQTQLLILHKQLSSPGNLHVFSDCLRFILKVFPVVNGVAILFSDPISGKYRRDYIVRSTNQLTHALFESLGPSMYTTVLKNAKLLHTTSSQKLPCLNPGIDIPEELLMFADNMSIVCIPLLTGESSHLAFGVLQVFAVDPSPPVTEGETSPCFVNDRNIVFLEAIADVIAPSLQLKIKRDRAVYDSKVVDICRSLNGAIVQEDIIQNIIRASRRLFNVKHAAFFIVDPNERVLECKCVMKPSGAVSMMTSRSTRQCLSNRGQYEVGDKVFENAVQKDSLLWSSFVSQQTLFVPDFADSIYSQYKDAGQSMSGCTPIIIAKRYSTTGDDSFLQRKPPLTPTSPSRIGAVIDANPTPQASPVPMSISASPRVPPAKPSSISSTDLSNTTANITYSPDVVIYSVICIPIVDRHGQSFGVLQCVNKINGEQYGFMDLQVAEELRHEITPVIQNAIDFEDARKSYRTYAALLLIMKACANETAEVDSVIQTIIQACYQMLEADRVTLYMIDDMNKELVARISQNLTGFRMPWSTGVAGYVARSGNILNTEDAYTCEFFDPSFDKKYEYRTRSILCMPIKDTRGKPMAVIQAINKKKGVFTTTDEQLLQAVIGEIAGIVKRQKVETEFWHIMTKQQDEDGTREMLSQYTDERRATLANVPRQQQKGPSKWKTVKTSLRLLKLSTESRLTAELKTWNFKYFDYDYDLLTNYVYDIFRYFNIIAEFHIPMSQFASFVTEIRDHYNDNIYHNFRHAFCVLHGTFMLLAESECITYLRPLDILSVLVASLCHDVDHGGFNNNFLIQTNHQFAVLYNDQSVLENHHAALAFELLYKPDNNFASVLAPDEFKQFRKVVCQAILSTDMTHHMEMTTRCQQYVHTRALSAESEEDRRFVMQLIVHGSDINNPVLNLDLHIKWTDKCAEEFYMQSKQEATVGIPVTAFMAKIDTLSKARCNLNFVEFIVSPLWSGMAELFPSLLPLIDQMESNRMYHVGIIESFEKKEPVLEDVQSTQEKTAITIASNKTDESTTRPISSAHPHHLPPISKSPRGSVENSTSLPRIPLGNVSPTPPTQVRTPVFPNRMESITEDEPSPRSRLSLSQLHSPTSVSIHLDD